MIKLSALVFQHFFRVLLRSNGEGVGKGPTIADGLSDRHGQQEVLLLDAGLFRVGHGHYTVSPQQQCAVGDLLDFCGFRASQRRKRATARRGTGCGGVGEDAKMATWTRTRKKRKKSSSRKDALGSLCPARAQPSTRPLFLMKATAEWVITRPDKTTAFLFFGIAVALHRQARELFDAAVAAFTTVLPCPDSFPWISKVTTAIPKLLSSYSRQKWR